MTSDSPQPWWRVVTGGDIEQGELLLDVSVYAPTDPDISDGADDVLVPVEDFRAVIIVSQSCDLDDEYALACPVETLVDLQTLSWSRGKTEQTWNNALRGSQPNYHALPEFDDQEGNLSRNASLVLFTRVLEFRTDRLRGLAANQGRRLRLGSPYREQLAQQFARKFMRVGLPLNLPDYKELPGNH